MNVRGSAAAKRSPARRPIALVLAASCYLASLTHARIARANEPTGTPPPPGDAATEPESGAAESGVAAQPAPVPSAPPLAVTADMASPTPAASAVGAAMNSNARALYEEGLRLYAARQFSAAVRELERGYAVDPRPEFLFAEAQALRLAGACERAVPVYRRFLEAEPSPIQVDAARLGIARCAPERISARVPAAAPAGPASSVSRGPSESAPAPAAWWHDVWCGFGVGGGVALWGVAAGFEVASRRARDQTRSPGARSYSEFAALSETAQQRRAIAVSSVIAGTVLVAAGGIRLLVLQRRDRASPGAEQTGAMFVRLAGGGALGGWEATF